MATMGGSRTEEEVMAAVIEEILSDPNANASELCRTHNIPRRTLMRRLAKVRAERNTPIDAPPPPEPPPKPEPTVVVVCGDSLALARQGLEAGIAYLANSVRKLDPEKATAVEVRAVGACVVKVLADVVSVLEHAKKDNGTPGAIGTLSDEELIEEAKKIAVERAAEPSEVQ